MMDILSCVSYVDASWSMFVCLTVRHWIVCEAAGVLADVGRRHCAWSVVPRTRATHGSFCRLGCRNSLRSAVVHALLSVYAHNPPTFGLLSNSVASKPYSSIALSIDSPVGPTTPRVVSVWRAAR
jgi:hypothetical protein